MQAICAYLLSVFSLCLVIVFWLWNTIFGHWFCEYNVKYHNQNTQQQHSNENIMNKQPNMQQRLEHCKSEKHILPKLHQNANAL